MYGPNFELVSYSHTVLAYIPLEYRLVIAGVGFLDVVVFLGSFIMHLVPLCASFYIFFASSHGSGQSYGTRMVMLCLPVGRNGGMARIVTLSTIERNQVP